MTADHPRQQYALASHPQSGEVYILLRDSAGRITRVSNPVLGATLDGADGPRARPGWEIVARRTREWRDPDADEHTADWLILDTDDSAEGAH